MGKSLHIVKAGEDHFEPVVGVGHKGPERLHHRRAGNPVRLQKGVRLVKHSQDLEVWVFREGRRGYPGAFPPATGGQVFLQDAALPKAVMQDLEYVTRVLHNSGVVQPDIFPVLQVYEQAKCRRSGLEAVSSTLLRRAVFPSCRPPKTRDVPSRMAAISRANCSRP